MKYMARIRDVRNGNVEYDSDAYGDGDEQRIVLAVEMSEVERTRADK